MLSRRAPKLEDVISHHHLALLQPNSRTRVLSSFSIFDGVWLIDSRTSRAVASSYSLLPLLLSPHLHAIWSDAPGRWCGQVLTVIIDDDTVDHCSIAIKPWISLMVVDAVSHYAVCEMPCDESVTICSHASLVIRQLPGPFLAGVVSSCSSNG